MPTYVYVCKKCGHQFETVQKMTDKPLKECPECKGEVSRLLFPPAIVFKGPGFHVNDYPSSGAGRSVPSKAEKAESATATKPETKKTATA